MPYKGRVNRAIMPANWRQQMTDIKQQARQEWEAQIASLIPTCKTEHEIIYLSLAFDFLKEWSNGEGK